MDSIFRFESIKVANEIEAEKFEEQLRNIQKKMQSMEGQFDACTEDLFNQTLKVDCVLYCTVDMIIISRQLIPSFWLHKIA